MARPLRIKFEGAWYHVMNRGVNRKKIFYNSVHKSDFLGYLNKTKDIYGIEIHAYCLMDNHYHLIIHTPRANISEAMKYLNACYARYFNLNLRRDGPVFRGRFKAIVIGDDEYLLKLSRYIHRNPISAKITNCLSSFSWSSYPAYLGVVQAAPWLTIGEIINRYGRLDFAIKYRDYVESSNNDELNYCYAAGDFSPVVGNSQFRRVVDEYVKLHSLSAEIVGADKIILPPKRDDIVNQVANYFRVEVSEIYETKGGINNRARRAAIYLCRSLGGCTLIEIAEIMGVTYKAISNVICRVKSNEEDMKVIHFLMQAIKLRCGNE